jgi:hypothetical protein
MFELLFLVFQQFVGVWCLGACVCFFWCFPWTLCMQAVPVHLEALGKLDKETL